MIDTWSTVGSCAQIGKRVHISGGVGIGGVLEPLQAEPVIIEDDCFIGARSEVAEGVIVRKGAVLSMGVFLGASTKIVDRDTGEIFIGEVPEYAVVVPGALPAQAAEERPARPVHRLRRDRQARRRAHPRQDQHQRAAAGLITAGLASPELAAESKILRDRLPRDGPAADPDGLQAGTLQLRRPHQPRQISCDRRAGVWR